MGGVGPVMCTQWSGNTSAQSLANRWYRQHFFQVGPHADPSSLTVGSQMAPHVDPPSVLLRNRDAMSPLLYIVLSGSLTKRALIWQRPWDPLRTGSPDVRVGELLPPQGGGASAARPWIAPRCPRSPQGALSSHARGKPDDWNRDERT